MKRIILVVHNVRSCHNVGSLLRTAEGLGIDKLYLSGYTPYPKTDNDSRLPHVSKRATQQIAKTALGAEQTMAWEYCEDILVLISELRKENFLIAALEQTKNTTSLPDFKQPSDIALLVGAETKGLDQEVLSLCDIHLEIPMSGKKESFNVSVAAGMALYHLKYLT